MEGQCYFSMETPKGKSWYSRGLARAKKKKNIFACVVRFVGGQEMGGAASLHELSVIVIIFSLFLSLFPISEKVWTKMGVFSLTKEKRKSSCLLSLAWPRLKTWSRHTHAHRHFVEKTILCWNYSIILLHHQVVHVVRTKKYTVFLNIRALKPIQCAKTTITLIKTRFCPHIHKHTLILHSNLCPILLIVLSTAGLFVLLICLSQRLLSPGLLYSWAKLAHSSVYGLYGPYTLLSFDSLHPQNPRVTD